MLAKRRYIGPMMAEAAQRTLIHTIYRSHSSNPTWIIFPIRSTEKSQTLVDRLRQP
jgi:hypothetical protein